MRAEKSSAMNSCRKSTTWKVEEVPEGIGAHRRKDYQEEVGYE